jgi:ribonuclease Z
MAGLWEAYSEDRRIRIEDENYPIEGIAIDAQEFTSDGVVYEAEDVRVTAFTVDHGEHIKPAFGYLIEFDGRSVVLSGDTRKSDAVIAHATGANLLVHEVAAVRPELLSDAQVLRVMNHHTSPQEAGEVFGKVAPGLAVYSHLVLLARPGVSALTADELIGQTRATYSGPLRVGEDLMTIELLPDGQASVVPEK